MASPESSHANGEKAPRVDDGGFSREPTFGTQANALFRKNLTLQKRNWKTNCCIINLPILLFVILVILQAAINSLFSGDKYKCGCQDGVCGVQFSDEDQASYCAIAHPPEWPGIMQVPRPQYRAAFVAPGFEGSSSTPATILYTGATSASTSLGGNLLFNGAVSNSSDSLQEFSVLTPGTASWLSGDVVIENSFQNNEPFYVLRNRSCAANAVEPDFDIDYDQGLPKLPYPSECLATQVVQRDSISTINDEIYKGFRKGDPKGNPDKKINEYIQAYDFRSTDSSNFDAVIYYNNTLTNDSSNSPPGYARVSRPMNLAAQAFLRFVQGPQAELPLWFVKEMPRGASKLRLDLTSLIGPLFYMWAIQLLFPVILAYLVYEKQQNLRIMMKMHGLGNRAYWFITYAYFFTLSLIYIFFFVLLGSIINLKFFRLNSYVIQFVFYFIYINLQIAIAFFAATLFSSVATATVVGYLYVLGFGLLGSFFFQNFLEDTKTGRGWIFAMELIPSFSLYRGLYELSQYAFKGDYQGTRGMEWSNLNDAHNGMTAVWGIEAVEWVLLLLLAWYLDQVISSGSGVKKHPLFVLRGLLNRKSRHPAEPVKSLSRTGGDGFNVEMEKPDVARERAVVERHLENPSNDSVAIVCDNLKKVYPGTDGNPDKYAVRGLSLAIGKSECFGMLGPNGAGKTSTINMLIGFLTPTSGTAYVNGLNIRTDMNKIYTSMGVCPQHDLVWGALTAREHLLFYGRLKNLKGAVLGQAVNDSLRSVNLFSVRNKVVGQYSGGMKRRLSVAISLIGNPQVVYMDEPSTGLDPASRYNLWSVVKQAKKDRAIILTTHSMEEAEALCDRLGIFVDGQLQCIGDSKELTMRYGGIYVLTVTTAAQDEPEILKVVETLTPNARKVYGLAGTQKFELPKSDVDISDVFAAMERAKLHFTVQAWGITDTTLEDVFIKVARDAQGDIPLT